ncbi:probably expressed as a fusion with ORF3 via a translational frameshift.; putative [Cereal yellow dwarf virus RPV]|uniref:71K protein n=1 Tax=Cereal yellow dwarf virus (isolate RPV) TaxID=2170100 RepID=Q89645_BYDVN|nr:RNA-dependent RNA polymerase P1 [Cereal yellow dwarf virus RPV]AAA42868.1 probably expressed as a fusion with ORF3 via a translational frameshift.; putative [Cereal yellow dwarf virus RPV]QIE05335.1 RNA-dependent RNA polymerase P1 [Cereal yellow dwarf virus RPV]BAA01053.1 ORF2 [Cereal yellow dwarf virus RPV]
MKSIYFVCLLAFCCQFSSQENLTLGAVTLTSPFLTPNYLFDGGSQWGTSLPSPLMVTFDRTQNSASTCPPCQPALSTSSSYSDIIQVGWQKLSLDSKSAFKAAWSLLKDSCTTASRALKAAFHDLVGKALWLLVLIWTGLLRQLFSAVWSAITNYSLPVCLLISLGIITSWLWKACRWLFGTLPALLCITLVKNIFRILTFKRFFNEKTVSGYDSYSIPSTPPKRSVIMMRRQNKEHIGYANCIRLFDGRNAIVTVAHNIEEGCSFYSSRTSGSIPITEFRVIFESKTMDIAILVGPINWESILGCKGVHFTTADRLAECPAALYLLDSDGQWRSNSAKICGHFDNFAQVLSNTKVGHSGAGYFYGKTLVGLHKGHPGKDFNFNLMAPLPGIPGLTSPQYVVESDPPQGLVFPEEVTESIEAAIKEATMYKNVFANRGRGAFKSKSGINWEDIEDESGNGKAAASAVTNAAAANKVIATPGVAKSQKKTAVPSSPKAPQPPAASQPTSTTGSRTPICPIATATSPDTAVPTGPSQQEIMNNIMNLLVQRIDMSKIEKSIVDQVANQALKKPRGKRGSKKRPAAGKSSSPTSTPGTYQHPNKKSQASNRLGNSPPSTTRAPAANQNGGENSVPNTLSWVRKLPVSGGPKSGHPLN